MISTEYVISVIRTSKNFLNTLILMDIKDQPRSIKVPIMK